VSYLQTALGMVLTAITGPELTYTNPNDPPSLGDWAAYGSGVATLLLSVFGLPFFNLSEGASYLLDLLLGCMSGFTLAMSIGAFIDDGSFDPSSDASFAAAVIGTVPGMINLIKFFGEEAAILVAGIDVLAGLIVGVIDMGVASAS
jgi:hypothetical protein